MPIASGMFACAIADGFAMFRTLVWSCTVRFSYFTPSQQARLWAVVWTHRSIADVGERHCRSHRRVPAITTALRGLRAFMVNLEMCGSEHKISAWHCTSAKTIARIQAEGWCCCPEPRICWEAHSNLTTPPLHCCQA